MSDKQKVMEVAVDMAKEILELKAENEKLKEDRDLWKQSERDCDKQYNILQSKLKEAVKGLEIIEDGYDNGDGENGLQHSIKGARYSEKGLQSVARKTLSQIRGNE